MACTQRDHWDGYVGIGQKLFNSQAGPNSDLKRGLEGDESPLLWAVAVGEGQCPWGYAEE